MRLRYKHWNHSIWQPEYKRLLRLHYRCTTLQIPNKDLKSSKLKPWRANPYETCSAVRRHKIASKSLQNSCTAKLQLFSSILEAKQQFNSSCSGLQKRWCSLWSSRQQFCIASVTLQFSCARSDSTTFLSAHNMNRQKSLLPQIMAFITRKLWLYL